jgi:PDZ domain-containing secreted protein
MQPLTKHFARIGLVAALATISLAAQAAAQVAPGQPTAPTPAAPAPGAPLPAAQLPTAPLPTAPLPTTPAAPSPGAPQEAQQPRAELSTVMSRSPLGITVDYFADGTIWITRVNARAAGARLGLEAGDEILAIDGRRFPQRQDLIDFLQALDNRRVRLEIYRDGQARFVDVYYENGDFYATPRFSSNHGALGITVQVALTYGVEVGDVYLDSPAYQVGLQTGDLIFGLNGRRYKSADLFIQAVAGMAPGEEVLLDVWRQGHYFSVYATLSDRAVAFDHGHLGYRANVDYGFTPPPQQVIVRPN